MMRRGLSMLILGLVVVWPGRAVAIKGVVHLGRRVVLGDFGGDLELGLDRDQRKQDQPQAGGGFTPQEATQTTWREAIGLHTRGFVYHPRFLIFRLKGRWTLQQGQESGTGQRDNVNARLTDYSADGTFLQAHPYSLDLLSNRTTSIVDSTFTPQRVVTRRESQVALRLKRLRMPTTFRLRRASSVQQGTFPYQERHDQAHMDSQYWADTSRATFTYDYDSQDSTSLANNLVSHRAFLTVAADLDPEYDGRANGEAEIFRQSGNVLVQRNRGEGRFHWAFSDTVTSDLTAEVDNETIRRSNLMRVGLHGQLHHRLYQSLFTTFSGRVERLTIDAGLENEVGGVAAVTYRKQIPGGVLAIELHGGRSYTSDSGFGGQGQRVDEPHTIPVEGVVALDQPGVLGETVVVTDPTGLIFYVRGVDYDLFESRGTTLLTTRFGGRLRPGRSIVVDYAFQSQPDAAFVTLDRGAGVSLSFGWGLQLYLRKSSRHLRLTRGAISEDRLEPERNTEAGISLVHGPSTSSVTYAERINPNSPFRRLSAEELLNFRPYRNLSCSLSGRWGLTHLLDLQQTFQGRTVRGQVQWDLRGRLSVRAYARYGTQDQIGETVDTVAYGVEMSARYRAYRLELTDRQERYQSTTIGQTDENILYVRLTRAF